MKCRHCGTELSLVFLDLGSAPPSNAYLTEKTLHEPEKWFPLRVLVCTECWLAQTEDFAKADELFDQDYAYFSSASTSWLKHAENYVEMAVKRFGLSASSTVVEIASNDGYLLQYVQAAGVPCYGIEPTKSTATAALAKGIPTIPDFFGEDLAVGLVKSQKSADLIVANNVLAHVPDINDFLKGVATLLKDDGVATFEFPHLLNLVELNQFDTIYHEHFSYLSLSTVMRICVQNGLEVFDVEELPTHGGSLRVYAQRAQRGREISEDVIQLLTKEHRAGMGTPIYYRLAQHPAELAKQQLLSFLLEKKAKHERVIAYGAAAKGNTLLNFAGVKPDLLPYVVDRSPSKIGKYLPGSRIPIVDEEILKKVKPEYVLILPWNLKKEITEQLDYVRSWGGKFVTAIPGLMVF